MTVNHFVSKMQRVVDECASDMLIAERINLANDWNYEGERLPRV